MDRELCAEVLAAFIGGLRRSLRRRAKRELGLRSVEDAQIGAITFVQRGDSSLRLNVHFQAPRCRGPMRLVEIANDSDGDSRIHVAWAAVDEVDEVDEIEPPPPRPVSRATSTTVWMSLVPRAKRRG